MRFLAFLPAFLLALTLSAQADPWKLVWSDDFDTPGAPDPTKWTYEKGFVRNQELQLYTDRRENARVEGGNLIIEARKETVPNPAYEAVSSDWTKARQEAEYTSACVTTEGLKTIRYGKVEVRAKLPSGMGTWPAIWLLGVNRGPTPWPMCGEVDIMEATARKPGRFTGALHFARPGTTKHQAIGTGGTECDSLYSSFHVYGLEWNEKTITLLFDDKAIKTVDVDVAGVGDDSPFRKPFYLLLNLAIGRAGGTPDPSVYPQQLVVDWVKVWQK